ncbi:hypothetical protein LB566_09645 [Mesorhizobium sp. CA13]|uniref:hypothetical protein n=1 Tax=Mesorhizobium sp. CA13 TaxID=2876643 RepID=UPI001CCAA880|nr:hypothetical protein [Mesorhizobium sp. CA13]MBZ9854064.1 hypothetical protein [Mesorhizobium sp. CA13]
MKDRDRNDSAHNIFQYPAMMVPKVQRRLLGAVLDARPSITSIYDPFVGSGTSLVSGMHYGLNAYGNDINPLAVLLSRVRTARRVESGIGLIAEQVVIGAKADRKRNIETALPNHEKWFHDEVAEELSRLRRSIRRCDDLWVRRFLWATLAETVRLTSNDRTSTYKLHARPTEEIAKRKLSPFAVFKDLARDNCSSILAFRKQLENANNIKDSEYRSDTSVFLRDTREVSNNWSPGGFDLIMTSPPYGDNLTTVTYGQHSYLPLHWIDFNDIDEHADADAVRTTHELDARSLGGSIRGSTWNEETLFENSVHLKRFADSLPPKPGDGRTRLIRFYGDFAESLTRIIKLLSADGYMIWTVGNRSISGLQVPTDIVLSELLDGQGCKVITTLTRQIHHKRMPHRNASSATMKEEKILLVRKSEK